MSLFGSSPASKPLFGSTPASSSGSTFNFGSPAATTTTPSLFGSATTGAAKPLFGATSQAASSGSLFGTTSSAPSTGLFGTSTTASTAGGGLFGSTTATSSSGGLFGSTTSGGLFSKPGTTTFGSGTTSGGLFGSKPAGTSLFGAAAGQQQPATQMRDTVETIFQHSDALVRSITNPEIYGDDRDRVIARLNQLAAALGVGAGIHKHDQPGVPYNNETPFFALQSVSYNRASDHVDSDGYVALTVRSLHSEFASPAQRQKFIDTLFTILGNKPGLHAHIESVRALPEGSSEVVIYVTEKGRGRISSRELCQFLNQQTQKSQLETQLKVDPHRIVSRVKMSKQQLQEYLKDTPAGIEPALWQQAARENPDSERLVPVVVRGYENLKARNLSQAQELNVENRVLDSMNSQLTKLENRASQMRSQLEASRAKQKELSYRLLRVMTVQLANARMTLPIDPVEDQMQGVLEMINARLNAPNQLKDRLTELTEQLRAEDAATREKSVSNSEVSGGGSASVAGLSENDLVQLKRYLARCQDGLETLVSTANKNLRDLQILANSA